MRRSSLAVLAATGLVIVVLLGAAALGNLNRPSQQQSVATANAGNKARTVAHLKARFAALVLPAQVGGQLTYPAEGITVSAPPAGASSSSHPGDVVASFEALPPVVGHFSASVATTTPEVGLVQVIDAQPLTGDPNTTQEYLAWLVVAHGTQPVLYGPHRTGGVQPDPGMFSCDLVGIQNASTGVWTKIFQSCTHT